MRFEIKGKKRYEIIYFFTRLLNGFLFRELLGSIRNFQSWNGMGHFFSTGFYRVDHLYHCKSKRREKIVRVAQNKKVPANRDFLVAEMGVEPSPP